MICLAELGGVLSTGAHEAMSEAAALCDQLRHLKCCVPPKAALALLRLQLIECLGATSSVVREATLVPGLRILSLPLMSLVLQPLALVLTWPLLHWALPILLRPQYYDLKAVNPAGLQERSHLSKHVGQLLSCDRASQQVTLREPQEPQMLAYEGCNTLRQTQQMLKVLC